MLGWVFSPLGRFLAVILLIAGIGAFGYYQHLVINGLHSKIDTLATETTALQTWNSDLQRDIEQVQKLQQATNKTLSNIRQQSAAIEDKLQQRQFHGDPGKVQQQVNQETAASFARIQSLSRAP